MFSTVAATIYIPTNSVRGFFFFHTLSCIYYLQTFNDGHSDWCEVIPHCSFDLHFSGMQKQEVKKHLEKQANLALEYGMKQGKG